MLKPGKKTRANQRANRILARDFHGSRHCEATFPHDCTGSEQLTWAHNMKRRKQPDPTHAALICRNAHDLIEILPPDEMRAIVDEIVASRQTQLPEAA